jgi:hypothetical protein
MLVNMLPRPSASPSAILFLRLTILGASTSFLLTLTGCAPGPHPAATSAAPAQPTVVGEIAMVDEEKRFVLVDLDSNLYVPAPGTALRATNSSGATARLKASPEQKRPFIAADIVDGDPVVGDQVFR